MAALGAWLLLLMATAAAAAPQVSQLSGGGGGEGGGVVVRDILEKVLETMQLSLMKNVKFCDENSAKQKAPYTCLAKKLPKEMCDDPIKVGDTSFCQDFCPATLQEDMIADMHVCRKVSSVVF